MKKSIIATLIAISLVMTVAFMLYNAFANSSLYPCKSILPQNISVVGNNVKTDGLTGNSAYVFRDYEYYFENNKLYIKLRYSLYSKNIPNASGYFYVDITDENISKVDGIYFTNGKSKKPIWSPKHTIISTMNDDREKFEEAGRILLDKLEKYALESSHKLRVCYEYSIISNEGKDTYMLLPIQQLSDHTIISNYLLNTNTSEIYEGDFDVEQMELIFGEKFFSP